MPVHHLTLLRQITGRSVGFEGECPPLRLLPQCAYLLCKPCQRRISRKRGSFFYWIVLRGKIEALARKIFVRRGRLSAVFVRLTLLRQITGRSVGFEGGVSPLRRLLPQCVSVAESHKTKLKQISVFGAAPFGGLSIAENCHYPYAGGYFHFTLY